MTSLVAVRPQPGNVGYQVGEARLLNSPETLHLLGKLALNARRKLPGAQERQSGDLKRL